MIYIFDSDQLDVCSRKWRLWFLISEDATLDLSPDDRFFDEDLPIVSKCLLDVTEWVTSTPANFIKKHWYSRDIYIIMKRAWSRYSLSKKLIQGFWIVWECDIITEVWPYSKSENTKLKLIIRLDWYINIYGRVKCISSSWLIEQIDSEMSF